MAQHNTLEPGTTAARLPPRTVQVDEHRVDRLTVSRVPLGSLRESDSPRLKGESSDHIRALAEADTTLPAITVHRPSMRIIDGMHRYRAAQLRGDDTIEVRFVECPDADAFVYSVEANIAHGLPLSLADRKAAAERIVGSHPQWSDRVIARAVGLSHKTVGAIRQRPAGEITQLDTRVGNDGRVRPVDGANGRRRAGELIRNDPDAPLRKVARVAGISAETARNVRARLRRGESPVLPTQREQRPRADPDSAPAAARRYPVEQLRRTARENLEPIVRRLAEDPSIRFNETGRLLLRLLHMHSREVLDWERLIENVPAHCADAVADAANQCAEAWHEVVERLTARS